MSQCNLLILQTLASLQVMVSASKSQPVSNSTCFQCAICRLHLFFYYVKVKGKVLIPPGLNPSSLFSVDFPLWKQHPRKHSDLTPASQRMMQSGRALKNLKTRSLSLCNISHFDVRASIDHMLISQGGYNGRQKELSACRRFSHDLEECKVYTGVALWREELVSAILDQTLICPMRAH